ncbi:MAG: DUF4931 domain-containing protein [Nitrospirota bacterium]
MENELRRDPVTGNWVVMTRNDTTVDEMVKSWRVEYSLIDEGECPFCEGKEKETPPEIFALRKNYSLPDTPDWDVRVVPNKFPIFQIHGALDSTGIGVYDKMRGVGAHEIVIETPQHTDRIESLSLDQIKDVLHVYKERILDLKRDIRFRYILVYKNFGPSAGAVIPHSHSHIIATPITPWRIRVEFIGAKEHYIRRGRCIFCDIKQQELDSMERVISENNYYLAFAPFASMYPFQVWIMPKEHNAFFEEDVENLPSLAQIFQEMIGRIAEVLKNTDYIYAIHTGPNMLAKLVRSRWKTIEEDFHWHIEIIPKLRRFTGFEIGAGFHLNPVFPEDAAKYLRF